MTLNHLHKLVTKLIADGYGRHKVVVNKDSFKHPCEGDGCVYLGVSGVATDVVYVSDGDGGTALDSKGRERTTLDVVIYGDSACKHGRVCTVGECEACARDRVSR